jgi:hypothetical protein
MMRKSVVAGSEVWWFLCKKLASDKVQQKNPHQITCKITPTCSHFMYRRLLSTFIHPSFLFSSFLFYIVVLPTINVLIFLARLELQFFSLFSLTHITHTFPHLPSSSHFISSHLLCIPIHFTVRDASVEIAAQS